jgi:hypothetical protein
MTTKFVVPGPWEPYLNKDVHNESVAMHLIYEIDTSGYGTQNIMYEHGVSSPPTYHKNITHM